MLIRRLAECSEFVAGDGTVLREYLHPERQQVDLRYSLAHASLRPGRASLRHRLSVSEVYCILEGEGRMTIDSESRLVAKGDVVYIPPGSTQSIECLGDSELRFLCIVDPAWKPEIETVG